MAKSGFATGFAGFLIGVVTGLGIAAAAAVFITKSPVPFVDKVDKVTADVDPTQKLAGSVDPNARLNQMGESQSAQSEAAEATGGVKTVRVASDGNSADGDAQPRRDAAGKAVEPGHVTPVTYWVQVAAFAKKADAETSAAGLAMMGIGAQVTQAGAFWRVRVGPFDDRAAAQEALESLADQGHKPVITEQK